MSNGNTPAPSPVRAITSTLSTRVASTVPPASQTYEPLARVVLRRRLLYDILPLSVLPVWTSAICWKMWNSGGMSASGILNTLAIPIHPGTLFMTTIVWVFGVLPLIVLRKSQLTSESINKRSLNPNLPSTAVPTPSSSPSRRVKAALSKPHTLRALSLYILASILVSTSHVVFGAVGGDHFGVFIKSRHLFSIPEFSLQTYVVF